MALYGGDKFDKDNGWYLQYMYFSKASDKVPQDMLVQWIKSNRMHSGLVKDKVTHACLL